MKLQNGDQFPELEIKNIHGNAVELPDREANFVHLQFRRFSGCPICNLHLQGFIKRNDELKAAGIHEVVVFHSPDSSLLEYQGSFPFDVIGDPTKKLYKQFGVESGLGAILNPKAIAVAIKANLQKNNPKLRNEGGPLGKPAEFLISRDGKIIASKYGKHAADQWSFDEVLLLTQKAASN